MNNRRTKKNKIIGGKLKISDRDYNTALTWYNKYNSAINMEEITSVEDQLQSIFQEKYNFFITRGTMILTPENHTESDIDKVLERFTLDYRTNKTNAFVTLEEVANLFDVKLYKTQSGNDNEFYKMINSCITKLIDPYKVYYFMNKPEFFTQLYETVSQNSTTMNCGDRNSFDLRRSFIINELAIRFLIKINRDILTNYFMKIVYKTTAIRSCYLDIEAVAGTVERIARRIFPKTITGNEDNREKNLNNLKLIRNEISDTLELIDFNILSQLEHERYKTIFKHNEAERKTPLSPDDVVKGSKFSSLILITAVAASGLGSVVPWLTPVIGGLQYTAETLIKSVNEKNEKFKDTLMAMRSTIPSKNIAQYPELGACEHSSQQDKIDEIITHIVNYKNWLNEYVLKYYFLLDYCNYLNITKCKIINTDNDLNDLDVDDDPRPINESEIDNVINKFDRSTCKDLINDFLNSFNELSTVRKKEILSSMPLSTYNKFINTKCTQNTMRPFFDYLKSSFADPQPQIDVSQPQIDVSQQARVRERRRAEVNPAAEDNEPEAAQVANETPEDFINRNIPDNINDRDFRSFIKNLSEAGYILHNEYTDGEGIIRDNFKHNNQRTVSKKDSFNLETNMQQLKTYIINVLKSDTVMFDALKHYYPKRGGNKTKKYRRNKTNKKNNKKHSKTNKHKHKQVYSKRYH